MKQDPFPFKIEKRYRLINWDYSNKGYYFVTICTQNREKLFVVTVGTDLCVCSSTENNHKIGEINEIGKMVEKWWKEIPNKFPEIVIDKYVVMPNHLHGILIIKNIKLNGDMEQTRRSVPTIIEHNIFGNVELLGRVIQWFKTMTTNEYIRNVKQKNWPKFSKRLWQSRYHDRIIRSEKEYWAKRIYIENNPKNWGKDKENKLNSSR